MRLRSRLVEVRCESELRSTNVETHASAAALELSANDLREIEAAIPATAAAGERYPTAVLAHMDSEKQEPAGGTMDGR